MQAFKSVGRTCYALGLSGLGVLSIVYGDFILGRPPATCWSLQLNPAMGYVCGALLLAGALIILTGFATSFISMVIEWMIIIFSLPRHLVQFDTDWLNGFKAIGLTGGAFVVAICFSKAKKPGWLINLSCLLLSAFFLAAGYAHFLYADFVKEFIPSYIPFRGFFTYACGICLLAGGIGILIPFTRKWAALLSAFMLSGWFILLHIPRFIADTSNKSDRLGVFESLTFAGIFFCLAAFADRGKRN